jgi:solute carrier family 25 (mitochondrial S-adenosylmethionine transporter), member 26
MSGSGVVRNNGRGDTDKSTYIETLVKLGKEEGAAGLFAGATPRVAKAFLSGAIQFATYEETKQSIARLLQNRYAPR